jgi:hypothetical protein
VKHAYGALGVLARVLEVVVAVVVYVLVGRTLALLRRPGP